MSENGEGVARSSYGSPRCLQLTSIQDPKCRMIFLREKRSRVRSLSSGQELQGWKSPKQILRTFFLMT